MLARFVTLTIGLMLAVSTVWLASSCTGAPRERPNILLISIDSLRADHIGALGYEKPTTPVLDRLARTSAVFSHALTTSSWTLPAHAALLTGLPDDAHGVVTPSRKLDERVVTLAEALRDEGYRTVGFYSGPFLAPSFGFEQGFERYVDCTSYGAGGSRQHLRTLHAKSHADRTNPNVLWNVLHELDRSDDRPFFFFVHMWDVHYDLIAPIEFVRLFDAGYPQPYDGSNYRHDPSFAPGMDRRRLEHVLALYDAEIRYTDATIGMIVDAFEQRGLLDDTILVVTSDHGDEFLDHGDKGHRHTLYQELIRVPLLVRWPGVVVPRRSDEPVSLVDVTPTLLALIGAEPLARTFGRSLADPLRAGRDPERRAIVATLDSPRTEPRIAAVVYGTDKLIVDEDEKRITFYDLAADPTERRPLRNRNDQRVRELLQSLRDWRERARATGRKLSTPAAAPDAATMSRLRALGYVD